ncbi:MAG: hypothetical protein S0880_33795 [Actinomycetota bacterium]|nr:hypothetical protein [Actinomycetota bacterium]
MAENHFNIYTGGGIGLTRFEGGEITRAVLVDPLGREARLYDPGVGSGLRVELEWEATGPLAGLMSIFGLGDWTLMVSAESRGAGPEPTFAPVTSPTTNGIIQGNRVRWTAQVPVTAAQLASLPQHHPNGATGPRRQGVYQFTVTVFWNADIFRTRLSDPNIPDLIAFADLNLVMVESVTPPETVPAP